MLEDDEENNNTVTSSTALNQHSNHVTEIRANNNIMRLYHNYSLGDWILIIVLFAISLGLETVEPHHHYVNSLNIPELSYDVTDAIIPDWLLFVLSLILPIIIFIFIHHMIKPGNRSWLQNAIEGLLFSFALTFLFTVILKKIVGRPRPNFYKLCKLSELNGVCQSSLRKRYSAYQSFPSGHSSLSFAGLGFLSLYLMSTFRVYFSSSKRNNLPLYCLLLSPLILAGYIATTRIHDYWHHYTDVLAGSVLGFVIAFNSNWLKFSVLTVDSTDMTHLLDDPNVSYGIGNDTVTVSMLRREANLTMDY